MTATGVGSGALLGRFCSRKASSMKSEARPFQVRSSTKTASVQTNANAATIGQMRLRFPLRYWTTVETVAPNSRPKDIPIDMSFKTAPHALPAASPIGIQIAAKSRAPLSFVSFLIGLGLRLTSKMSHASGRRDACRTTTRNLWFHLESPSIACGMTDTGVGSGALLG